jgi:hypothetical protein
VKHQAEELTTLQARLRDSQSTLSDSQGQLLPVQYELTKALREKDLLSKRVEELEAARTAHVNEVVELRREHAAKTVTLESSLSTATVENKEKQDRIKAMQVCGEACRID